MWPFWMTNRGPFCLVQELLPARWGWICGTLGAEVWSFPQHPEHPLLAGDKMSSSLGNEDFLFREPWKACRNSVLLLPSAASIENYRKLDSWGCRQWWRGSLMGMRFAQDWLQQPILHLSQHLHARALPFGEATHSSFWARHCKCYHLKLSLPTTENMVRAQTCSWFSFFVCAPWHAQTGMASQICCDFSFIHACPGCCFLTLWFSE